MPITAEIDELSPADLLLLLSLVRKTGKLSAVHDRHKILIALRTGSMVYASSSVTHQRVGSMLINRGLITEEQLAAAVERQQQTPGVVHLGNILEEMGAVSHADIEQVVRNQFESVLRELLGWRDGLMVFEAARIPDVGAIHVDTPSLLFDVGFDGEDQLLGGLADVEAALAQRAARVPEKEPAADEALNSEPEPSPVSDESDEQAEVRSLLDEMESFSVSLTAEMTLAILSAASQVCERGVLLLVGPDTLVGAGAFGDDRYGNSISGRELVLPRGSDSVFEPVIEQACPYRGPFSDTPSNRHVVDLLGGVVPLAAVVVPLVVRNHVVAVLYGDGGPEHRELQAPASLVTTMDQVAAHLEGLADPA